MTDGAAFIPSSVRLTNFPFFNAISYSMSNYLIQIITNPLNIGILVLGVAASIFFLHHYPRKPESRPVLSYLPNIWTSLGILGTFLAIVIALGDIDDWESLSIGDLVSKIVPAFVTSIIGIIGAIYSSLRIKHIFAEEDAAYEANNRKTIQEDLSPEQTLYQVLGNARSINAKMDGITGRIVEGVLEEVSRSLTEKLISIADTHSEELTKIFNKEKETLTGLSNLIIASIDNSSKTAVEALQEYQRSNLESVEDIEEQATSQLGALKTDALNAFTTLYEDLRAEVDSMSSQFVTSIVDIKTNTVSAIESSMETQSRMIVEKVTETTDSLVSKIEDMQADVAKASMNTQQSILNGVAAQTKDVVDSFNEGIERQTVALETLTEDYVRKIGNIAKEFGDNTDSTQRVVSSLLQQMQENAANDVSLIKTAMGEMVQKGADDLQAGIDASITALNGLTTNLTQSLAPLVGSFQSSYEQYDKTFKDAERILKELEKAETGLSKVLKSFDKDSSKVQMIYDKLERISEANRTLNFRLHELRHAFESSGKPLPTKCPSCGAEVENPLAEFCGKCGHHLFEEPQAT